MPLQGPTFHTARFHRSIFRLRIYQQPLEMFTFSMKALRRMRAKMMNRL